MKRLDMTFRIRGEKYYFNCEIWSGEFYCDAHEADNLLRRRRPAEANTETSSDWRNRVQKQDCRKNKNMAQNRFHIDM